MLTGDLVRPRMRNRGGRLVIDWLNLTEPRWQRTADDLITLLQQHTGGTQAAWEQAVETYCGDRTDYIVIRGLAKVLSDGATFTAIESPVDPAEIRQRLFAQGPVFDTPDLFYPHTRADVLSTVATEFGISSEQIERLLYADRPGEYRLSDPGPAWTSDDLIARYNLELARAALYWCDRMQITIHDTFKDFWRYLKLFKLMFEAQPIDGGYMVVLDGPISPFVQSTTRYGRQFAVFLPALFLCERWQMQATVQPSGFENQMTYTLDPSPLRSHFRRAGAFDSRLEADFAAEFQAKFGDARGKWMLTREDEVLLLGDTVMIPDFALTHKQDDRRALIEIMGFWHPEYLRRKLEKVRAANRRNLLLLVNEGVNLTADRLHDVPAEVLYFKSKPVLKDVLAAVERIAE